MPGKRPEAAEEEQRGYLLPEAQPLPATSPKDFWVFNKSQLAQGGECTLDNWFS